MKKFIIALIIFLIAIETGLCFTINNLHPDSPLKGEIEKEITTVGEDYFDIDFRYDSYTVTFGSITANKSVSSRIITDTSEYACSDTSLFQKSQIIEKDEIIDGFTSSSRYRVLNIIGKRIIMEDLSSTRLEIHSSALNKMTDKTKLQYQVTLNNKKLSITDYNFRYSPVDKDFLISVYLDNDGLLTGGMSCYVTYKETLYFEEETIYVPQNYIIYVGEEEQPCVMKLKSTPGGTYYLYVPVQITGSYENYVSVEGKLNNGNIIIQEQ